MNMTEEFQEELYLTSSEAARILHASPKTVSRWRKEGKLTTEQVRMRRTLGGHWRYNAEDCAELAHRLTHEGAA